METTVRTTVDLDDLLVSAATKMTGITKKTRLLEEGLRALMRKEAYAQVAALAGTMPKLKAAPRRRFV